MTKQELVRDMKTCIGSSFIKRGELAKYLNYKDPHSVDSIIHGLERFEKRYFISDVAERILVRVR